MAHVNRPTLPGRINNYHDFVVYKSKRNTSVYIIWIKCTSLHEFLAVYQASLAQVHIHCRVFGHLKRYSIQNRVLLPQARVDGVIHIPHPIRVLFSDSFGCSDSEAGKLSQKILGACNVASAEHDVDGQVMEAEVNRSANR